MGVRMELKQAHRNMERAEADTVRQEEHLEGIIHHLQAESYIEETAAASLRRVADPVFEITIQNLRDEYVAAKADAKAYKASHNAPKGHLVDALKRVELAEETEFAQAQQLREELAAARNELIGVVVMPPSSSNKYSWTGQRKPEQSDSPSSNIPRDFRQLKWNPEIVGALNRDQMQQLQNSVNQAAVAGASARRDFADGGSDGTGNVNALLSVLNEALQAEEAWSRATELMESATGGVHEASVKESTRNFQLKSEVESLWSVINDRNSEMGHGMA